MKYPAFRPQTYVPSPDDIAQVCREIRAGWSQAERVRRAIGETKLDEMTRSWLPPVIDTTRLRPTVAANSFDN